MAMSPPLSKRQVYCVQGRSSLDGNLELPSSNSRPASSLRLATSARHLGAYLVGWSEVAVRALSLFFGMLTLAWVYRTGRDLLAPRAGLLAALLLSASVFFLAYMIHARAFTLIALCSTLCIWSYWRLVLHPRPTGMGAPAGLLLGSVGLLYSHYFSCAVSACPRPVSSALRAKEPALVAARPADRRSLPCWPLLQLPGFLEGLERYSRRRRLCTARALSGNGCC